jgi:hypothetical protein
MVRALSGEQERDDRPRCGPHASLRAPGGLTGESGEALVKLLYAPGVDGQAVLERGAPGVGREADIGEKTRAGAQVVGIAPG